MGHKCKFVKFRLKKNRQVMSYKCHGCFKVIVVKKRTLHRMLLGKYKGPVPHKYLVVNSYYDVNDPRYDDYIWSEIFGYEANNA